jgi:hypothetical protein
MMPFKPILLGAGLVLALCGATQPADETSQPAAVLSPETAAEPSIEAAPEGTSVPADIAATSEAAIDAAVLQTPGTPDTEAAAARPADPAASPADPAAGVPRPDAALNADKPAVPAKGKPPTREYFVGVWAEQGKSCETALDFKADGTLIGPFPRWELSDTGELTMVGNRQKILLTVIDANTVQSRRAPTDPPRILKRCGG